MTLKKWIAHLHTFSRPKESSLMFYRKVKSAALSSATLYGMRWFNHEFKDIDVCTLPPKDIIVKVNEINSRLATSILYELSPESPVLKELVLDESISVRLRLEALNRVVSHCDTIEDIQDGELFAYCKKVLWDVKQPVELRRVVMFLSPMEDRVALSNMSDPLSIQASLTIIDSMSYCATLERMKGWIYDTSQHILVRIKAIQSVTPGSDNTLILKSLAMDPDQHILIRGAALQRCAMISGGVHEDILMDPSQPLELRQKASYLMWREGYDHDVATNINQPEALRLASISRLDSTEDQDILEGLISDRQQSERVRLAASYYSHITDNVSLVEDIITDCTQPIQLRCYLLYVSISDPSLRYSILFDESQGTRIRLSAMTPPIHYSFQRDLSGWQFGGIVTGWHFGGIVKMVAHGHNLMDVSCPLMSSAIALYLIPNFYLDCMELYDKVIRDIYFYHNPIIL